MGAQDVIQTCVNGPILRSSYSTVSRIMYSGKNNQNGELTNEQIHHSVLNIRYTLFIQH